VMVGGWGDLGVKAHWKGLLECTQVQCMARGWSGESTQANIAAVERPLSRLRPVS
jgi:hypothetical protein